MIAPAAQRQSGRLHAPAETLLVRARGEGQAIFSTGRAA